MWPALAIGAACAIVVLAGLPALDGHWRASAGARVLLAAAVALAASLTIDSASPLTSVRAPDLTLTAGSALALIGVLLLPGAPPFVSGRARTDRRRLDRSGVGPPRRLAARPRGPLRGGPARRASSGGRRRARLRSRRRDRARADYPRAAAGASRALPRLVGARSRGDGSMRPRFAAPRRRARPGRDVRAPLRERPRLHDAGDAVPPGRPRAAGRPSQPHERAGALDTARGRARRGCLRGRRAGALRPLRRLVCARRGPADRRTPGARAAREHLFLARARGQGRGSNRAGAAHGGALSVAGPELLRPDHRGGSGRSGALPEPIGDGRPRDRARRGRGCRPGRARPRGGPRHGRRGPPPSARASARPIGRGVPAAACRRRVQAGRGWSSPTCSTTPT